MPEAWPSSIALSAGDWWVQRGFPSIKRCQNSQPSRTLCMIVFMITLWLLAYIVLHITSDIISCCWSKFEHVSTRDHGSSFLNFTTKLRAELGWDQFHVLPLQHQPLVSSHSLDEPRNTTRIQKVDQEHMIGISINHNFFPVMLLLSFSRQNIFPKVRFCRRSFPWSGGKNHASNLKKGPQWDTHLAKFELSMAGLNATPRTANPWRNKCWHNFSTCHDSLRFVMHGGCWCLSFRLFSSVMQSHNENRHRLQKAWSRNDVLIKGIIVIVHKRLKNNLTCNLVFHALRDVSNVATLISQNKASSAVEAGKISRRECDWKKCGKNLQQSSRLWHQWRMHNCRVSWTRHD